MYYKLAAGPMPGVISSVWRSDGTSIPFASENVDYEQFKVDVLAGTELQSPYGVVLTQEEADAYIATLP